MERKKKNTMISKKIHYCWFGGKPLTNKAKKCIDSWKKYCPDYEIIEWNEYNFDFNECDYAKEAYESKKWAFVSDYARFKILYENGGIYFDVDVELIKPIDIIVKNGSFMGIENNYKDKKTINPGLGLGVESNHKIYKEILDIYHTIHFIDENGNNNLKTVVEYTTEILQKYGFSNIEEIQEIQGIKIYPKDYFNPMNMDTGKIKITDNTISIHHYAASWVDKYSIFRGKVYQITNSIFGKNIAEKIRRIVGRKNRV